MQMGLADDEGKVRRFGMGGVGLAEAMKRVQDGKNEPLATSPPLLHVAAIAGRSMELSSIFEEERKVLTRMRPGRRDLSPTQ